VRESQPAHPGPRRAVVVLSSDDSDSGDEGSLPPPDCEDEADSTSTEAASLPQDIVEEKDAIIEELRKELELQRLSASDAVAHAEREAKAATERAAYAEAILQKEQNAAHERENQAASEQNALAELAARRKLRAVLELAQEGVGRYYNLRPR
jgi:hypothetical protein